MAERVGGSFDPSRTRIHEFVRTLVFSYYVNPPYNLKISKIVNFFNSVNLEKVFFYDIMEM